jgi:SAM-dependent methyltransferase
MTAIQDLIKDKKILTKKPAKSHLIRFHMYLSIEKIVKKLSPEGIGLTISDWRPIVCTLMPKVKFYNLRYPEFDIQNLIGVPDNSVDVFYSEMILEHIENPQAAIDESYRILKPGGIAIHTTVFIMPYHPSPLDLHRFSPEQLKRMHYKYTEIYTGGYGNWRSMLALLLRITRFPVKYPNENILSWLLRGNNPKYMLTTYVVVRK